MTLTAGCTYSNLLCSGRCVFCVSYDILLILRLLHHLYNMDSLTVYHSHWHSHSLACFWIRQIVTSLIIITQSIISTAYHRCIYNDIYRFDTCPFFVINLYVWFTTILLITLTHSSIITFHSLILSQWHSATCVRACITGLFVINIGGLPITRIFAMIEYPLHTAWAVRLTGLWLCSTGAPSAALAKTSLPGLPEPTRFKAGEACYLFWSMGLERQQRLKWPNFPQP